MGGYELFPTPGNGDDDSDNGLPLGPVHGNPDIYHRRDQGEAKAKKRRLDKDVTGFPEELAKISRQVFDLTLFIKIHGKKVFFHNEGGKEELYYYDAYPYRFLVYDEEYEEGTATNIIVDFGGVEYQIVVVPEPDDGWHPARTDGSTLSIFRRRRVKVFKNYVVDEIVAVEVGQDSGRIETYQAVEFNRHHKGMLPHSSPTQGEDGSLHLSDQPWPDEDVGSGLFVTSVDTPSFLDEKDDDTPPSFVMGETDQVYYLLKDIIHILDFLIKGPPPLSRLYSAENIVTEN